MKDIEKFCKGSKNIKNIFDTVSYKIKFARNNPDYFYPSGIWVFCGPQGSGKTLSAVQCLKTMLKEYPKAKVISNMAINGLDRPVYKFTDYKQLEKESNGIQGLIFFLDEIHVLWNSLESREIPISEMACFCQMRKDRRVIIGTSQVYSRIAKPIREQLKYVVDCKCFFNLIQYNKYLDPCFSTDQQGEREAELIGRDFFFHSPALYKSYDTLKKIEKVKRND